MFRKPSLTAPKPQTGENLAKAALNRAILGRIPGERQPGGFEKPTTKTALSKFKRF